MVQQALNVRSAAGGDPVDALPSLAAHKIKHFRKQNRLTAADLAAQLGVSQPTVFYWETGQKVPRTTMQGELQARGICEPNDWHLPAPPRPTANDDGVESAA